MLTGKPTGMRPQEGPSVDGMTILECMLNEQEELD